MQHTLDQFGKWGDITNNIDVSNEKTVMMVFKPKSSQRPYNKIRLWLKGKPIEEVDFHKILGTVLDNQLSFESHFQQVVSRGYGVLQSIKSFSIENRIPCITPLVTLYKTFVLVGSKTS